MLNNNQHFDYIIKSAENLAKLYNIGEYVAANISLVSLMTSITDVFNLLTITQKEQFSGLLPLIYDCQKRKDYLAIADFLRFELPYILNHPA